MDGRMVLDGENDSCAFVAAAAAAAAVAAELCKHNIERTIIIPNTSHLPVILTYTFHGLFSPCPSTYP
jgi:hypothetical protein